MKVITLCGSIKFKDDFLKLQKKLTLKGNVVLIPNFFDDVTYTSEIKNLLGLIHKKKIEISDEVFIINKNGYIGETTHNEIEYAKSLNKPVFYLE